MTALSVVIALAATAAGAPVREEVPGGPELLVMPVEGAERASLRIVVRAGSAVDPVGREGLAHLLEHAVVEGSRKGSGTLLEEALAVGATVNATTSRDATRYLLDAPAPRFWPLAERLLRAVTSPRLERVDVEHHRGVIDSESEYASDGAEASRFVEDLIFGVPEPTPAGMAATRSRISRDDLVAWFQRSYLTSDTTVVFTGAVDAPQARAVLKRAFLLPPALPGEVVEPRPGKALLPARQRSSAPFVAVVHGYRLLPEERAACPQLAELVWLRLYLALSVRTPLLAPVDVQCASLRGNDFILAFGYTFQLDAPELPDRVAAVFREAASAPPSAAEKRLLDRRRKRLDQLLRADPALLADALSALAAEPRVGGATPPLPAALPVDSASLRSVVQRAFTPERLVSIVLTPFEH